MFSVAGCTLSMNIMEAAAIVDTVNTYIGTGYARVDTIGAPLKINLAKKLHRPKAVELFSTSKIRELAAII